MRLPRTVLAGLLVLAGLPAPGPRRSRGLPRLHGASRADGRDGAGPCQLGPFVERKYLRVTTAPLQSSGTLRYIAPNRLEKAERCCRNPGFWSSPATR